MRSVCTNCGRDSVRTYRTVTKCWNCGIVPLDVPQTDSTSYNVEPSVPIKASYEPHSTPAWNEMWATQYANIMNKFRVKGFVCHKSHNPKHTDPEACARVSATKLCAYIKNGH